MFSSLKVLSSTIDPRPSLIWPLQVGKNFFSIDIFCTTLSGHFSRASLYVRPVQHRFPRARAHLGSSSVGWPRFDLLEDGKIYVRGKSIKTYSGSVSISYLTKTIFFHFLGLADSPCRHSPVTVFFLFLTFRRRGGAIMDCGRLKEALPPDDPFSGCETQVLLKASRAVWIWAHVRITATREDMAR